MATAAVDDHRGDQLVMHIVTWDSLSHSENDVTAIRQHRARVRSLLQCLRTNLSILGEAMLKRRIQATLR